MKHWPIVYDRQALDDLEAIHDWIARQTGESTADRYEQRITAFIEQLRNFPEPGTQREDLQSGLRTIGFERRVSVACSLAGDRVRIVRILCGGRQFDAR